MHLLVTGAAGFLGRHVVRLAIAQGHRVRAVDLPGATMPEGAEPFALDVCDGARFAEACRDVDGVIHAAGIFDFTAPPERMRAVNVDGARIVAERAPGRLVVVSSSSVYGHAGRDANEDAPKRPRNDYERTKWDGELAATDTCRRRGVRVASLRPTLIYGPGGRYGLAVWLAQLALRAAHGLRSFPIARGGCINHHVHVEDVASAAILLATHAEADGAYNVADDAPITTAELLRATVECMGIRARDVPVPWSAVRRVMRVPGLLDWAFARANPRLERAWARMVERRKLVGALTTRLDATWMQYLLDDHSYDTSRLRALGFRAKWPELRAGIADTVRWYREARWLPDAAATAP